MARLPRRAIALALPVAAALSLGCGKDDGGACGTEAVNATIHEALAEWYLYPNQIPDIDPKSYSDSALYLRALVENVDLLPDAPANPPDHFSALMPMDSFESAMNGVHRVYGFMSTILPTAQGKRLVVLDVFGEYPGEPASPASEAGMRRGWQIQAVDGTSIPDLLANADEASVRASIGQLLDKDQVTMDLLDGAGSLVSGKSLQRREVTTRALATSTVLDLSGKKVGYLHLRDFIADSAFEQLRAAFAGFASDGVKSVVVDLRYNTGGNVLMAKYLGDLIAGADKAGALFIKLAHNPTKRAADEAYSLVANPYCPADAACAARGTSLIGIERVAVLATDSTASASELIISGLRPHVPLAVVGGQTLGKPVGMNVFQVCDWALMPLTFRIETAEGTATYFDGIPATCSAADDSSRPFGDPQEAMLAAALHWVDTGSCPLSSAALRWGAASPPAWRNPYDLRSRWR